MSGLCLDGVAGRGFLIDHWALSWANNTQHISRYQQRSIAGASAWTCRKWTILVLEIPLPPKLSPLLGGTPWGDLVALFEQKAGWKATILEYWALLMNTHRIYDFCLTLRLSPPSCWRGRLTAWLTVLTLSETAKRIDKKLVARISASIRSPKVSKGWKGIFLKWIVGKLVQLVAAVGLSSILRNSHANWPS